MLQIKPMTRHHFGTLPTGESVEAFTLVNPQGFSATVLTYGATLAALHAPDREGRLADVVLGFPDLAEYAGKHPYIGATVGRVAGRLTAGRFTLDGKTHTLAVNDPPNHLHGGNVGFNRRVWRAESSPQGDAVRLSYRSPDGEEGYPGNVDVAVTYRITGNNALVIESEATTNRATPLSLTHHPYFNLAGEGSGGTEQHELQIFAREHVPADDHLTLLGRREPVAGGPDDLNRPRRIGEILPGLHQSHGTLYRLPPTQPGKTRVAARACDPASGRCLTVETDEDYLQFYTGVGLEPTLIGKSGRAYGPLAGFCLECEGYPDGANHPELGDTILRPGQVYRRTTILSFTTK